MSSFASLCECVTRKYVRLFDVSTSNSTPLERKASLKGRECPSHKFVQTVMINTVFVGEAKQHKHEFKNV